MANQNPLPLYENNWYKHNYKRVTESLLLILLLLLLGYRVISVNNYSFPWFVAFLCESWFTISWFLTLTTQWCPAEIKTYPDRLLQSVQELPPVDLFVTTADPLLEPPIITVNTVLSLLAVDTHLTSLLVMFLTMVAPLLPSMLFRKLLNLQGFGFHSVRSMMYKLELHSDTSLANQKSPQPTTHHNSNKNGYR